MFQSDQSTLHVDHRDKRSIFRRVGVYMPVLVILGLALPALIFSVMMNLNGWHLPSLGLQQAITNTTAPSDKVYLYVSPTSKAYFATIGGNYDNLLNPWRIYIKERGISSKELNTPEGINAQTEGVLIVPSALALSDQERDSILSFKSKGGGVLATWATGTRNGSGEWSGWHLLEALGVKVAGELPEASEARQLTLNGASPVSYQQLAGSRIWMGKTKESLLRMKGENLAARFMDWPRVLDDERHDEGAILFSEPAPNVGRSVVFAFAETTWESRPFAMHQVLDDTLQWLARKPAVIQSAWPNGKRAAQIIEMDTEQGFENATPFADLMKSIQYRSTFYVLTSVAVQYPEVLKGLSKDFEIGYHGDIHNSFKDQTAAAQEQRIVKMKSELGSILGDTSQVTGFRAPTEGYDETTELMLKKNGIGHHAADPSRLEWRLPAFVKMAGVPQNESLVVLPRTQRDDINLYWEKLSAEQTSQALKNDFDLVMDSAALGLLSVHSQNFAEGSVLRSAMPDFLSHIQKQRMHVWLASSGQVTQWWRDRARVSMSSMISGKRLDFNVSVKGDQPVEGVTFIIMLPAKGVTPQVRSTKIGTLIPEIERLDDYRAMVVFQSLKPGDYIYQIAF